MFLSLLLIFLLMFGLVAAVTGVSFIIAGLRKKAWITVFIGIAILLVLSLVFAWFYASGKSLLG